MSLTDTLFDIRSIYKVTNDSGDDYLSNNWFIITVVVISTLNHPEDIHQVYKLIDQDVDAMNNLSPKEKNDLKVKVVAKLRDAILKGFIAGGFPKTINGLRQLYDITPETIRQQLSKQPIRQEETWEQVKEQRQKGQALFDKIYDQHTSRVMTNMGTTYPDLAQTAHYHLYGSVLSDTTMVSAKETSLIVVAGCHAQDLPSQLRGHSYGAIHNGASPQDLQLVYQTVISLCRYYGAPIPSIPKAIKSNL
ncbi:AhpD-like protein [Chlamydoabsidia padenii]|nr:AhpD-like protein [Chlamydoabsidia padenii]